MKKTNLASSRTINKLREYRSKGKKSVIWKISEEERMYIEDVLDCRVENYLYEVKTKTFKNLAEIKNQKLKTVHLACKNNKQLIVMQLDKEDKEDFSKYDVKYRPVKFKIILNA